MNERTAQAPTLAGYQLRLPAFEGPLDVLLGLIERERLEISDLSLVSVTDGFLAYVDELRDAPPALLAEFAGIAARLLVLKSRALLPRPEVADPDPDLDDLATQLREYQAARRVALAFREKEQAGWRAFARSPLAPTAPPRITLVAPPVAHLRRALLRAVARVRPEPQVAPIRQVVSIGEMLHRLRDRLTRFRHPSRFHDLVGAPDREHTIVGFIALLALWRRGEVRVRQDALFGEIHVEPVLGAAGDD
jgi:segregation and condensation protein A